nr:phage tail protein [Sphingomonas sp. BT552]
MKLATGSGVPARRLNLTSIAVAANLADELVNRSVGGQEPRYHGAGVISEGDDPKTVLDMLCTASCARFRDTGGKLSLVVAHNDLAGAATDDGLNDDDVVGPFTWDPDAALESTPNIVRGKYVDATPNSLYQLIEYPEVRIASPDGQDRIFPLDLGVVESPSQAQRIAKQVLQRKQYPREFSAPFDIRAWKYGIGDVVPFTFAPLSFNRRLFRVKDQELGQNGVCNMTLTIEAAAIYAWDADDRAAVQPAEAITYDSRNNPLVLAIADIDAAVTAIFSDGVVTHGREKRELVRQWQAIEAQFLALDARYAGLGSPADIASARGLAYQAYQQLAAYLAGLNPAWDAIDLDTPIPDPALADQRWAAARTKIEAFGAAITGREGPAGADGGSSFTLVDVGNCTAGPNSVVKSTGGADWNGKARTAEHAPAATVSALLVPGTFVGLTTDPTADTSFSSIDYAVHWSGNTNIYIYRNGVGTAPLAARAPGAGPVRATVKSDGKQVFYELEGVDLSGQTEIVVLPGADLYGSIAIFSQGIAVNGVTFSRDGVQGAGSTNLVSMSPTTIVAGNSVRGTSGGFWGIDAAYSRESYTGGAVANFTVPAANGDLFMAGLTQGIGGDRGKSYDGISFALHRNGNTGGTGAFINGVQFGAAGPVVPGVLRGRVHFDGRYVRWFVNEQMFAQFDWMGTTYDPHDPANALRFACSLAAVSRIDNISLTAAGTKGTDGRDGTNGTNGLNGTNGQSIHIAYSDAADGSVNFTTGEAGGRTFIGVYTDTNPGADSTNPAAYGWTRLRGLDGTNGINGPGGYVHIAYANSANGTVDFHLSDPTGRTYIGTYTDQTEPDSGNPATYAWQLVKGADGKDGINGTNGANADQLGLGVLANGSLGMSIPSSGSTTFTDYSQTINVVAGRQFKLTMVAVNGFRNTGSNVAVATIRVVLGNQVLFSGTISVDADGSIYSSNLEDASTKLIANNVSGSAQLVITHSRGGPIGNSADFDFNFILERV